MLLSASRTLLETTLRNRPRQNSRIAFLEGAEVIALRPAQDGRGIAGVNVRWRVLRHALRHKHKNEWEPAADRVQSVT